MQTNKRFRVYVAEHMIGVDVFVGNEPENGVCVDVVSTGWVYEEHQLPDETTATLGTMYDTQNGEMIAEVTIINNILYNRVVAPGHSSRDIPWPEIER